MKKEPGASSASSELLIPKDVPTEKMTGMMRDAVAVMKSFANSPASNSDLLALAGDLASLTGDDELDGEDKLAPRLTKPPTTLAKKQSTGSGRVTFDVQDIKAIVGIMANCRSAAREMAHDCETIAAKASALGKDLHREEARFNSCQKDSGEAAPNFAAHRMICMSGCPFRSVFNV